MAKKVEETKTNKVLEVLRKEYPFEKILLGVLGTIVLVLGIYIYQGELLQIRYTSLWIFNTELKIKIFSVFVIVVGAVSLLLAVWPFFVPSIGEMKKVSWPKRDTIINHSSRVFGFIILLALFFFILDFGFLPLKEYLTEISR